jgi:uncharacterized protein YdeI (YjbR/CyaY-like superfamily)
MASEAAFSKDLPLLELASARAWRTWLTRHHATSQGVWLVFHKAHTGTRSMSYLAALDEALCFGWIDSLVKRLDDDRFTRKFTPRRPASKWSDVNRKRWAELKAAERLSPAGVAAAPTANSYAPKPRIPILPAYIATAFKTNAAAWRFFQSLPPRERRMFVWWIHTAKRPETRERRIAESIATLAAGRRLGLK